MQIDMTSLTNEELLALYYRLLKEKQIYADDLKYTQRALAGGYIDYVTEREYKNDIIRDDNKIREIDERIAEIGTKIEIPNEKVKKKELKNNFD